MRLLDGPGPQVHRCRAGSTSRSTRRSPSPARPSHQIERLAISLAVLHRRDAVGEVHVHRTAERQPGHEPPPADAVEHPVLLGDADGRRGGRQGHAHLHDGHVEVIGLLGQHAAHQVRARHEPVGVLMMLVGADAVESGARRVEQLVERPVVVLAHALARPPAPTTAASPTRSGSALEVVRAARGAASDETR